MKVDDNEIKNFQKKIRKFYRFHGRELPFRFIDDPYAVTVSELMLQQTQVERVIPKFHMWMKQFPTWEKLSKASNQSILSAWSGLGYNRRALYLKKIADVITNKHYGVMPTNLHELQKLPGIGVYTSHAILIFAFQKRLAAVDTNIRKVILSSFDFSPETSVKVTQQLAEHVLPKSKIREWHYALMDYAKTLPSDVHKRYAAKHKQTKFEGSLRQIRGEIIRQLTKEKHTTFIRISKSTRRSDMDISDALASLEKEGTINISKNIIKLS